jgi:Sulfotransferase family
MAVYSLKHGYIFFANPQTASKAIARTLREALDGRPMPPDGDVVRGGEVIAKKHHASWADLQAAGLMTREQLDGLFKFTCVRNPYDLLVSRYLKRRGRFTQSPEQYKWAQHNERIRNSMGAALELSFPDWVAQEFKRHAEKGRTVTGPLEYLDHADHVIRFEALQEGFDEVVRRLGFKESIPLVSENVTSERGSAGETAGAGSSSKRKHYTEFYDEPSRVLVGRIYAPIIERFGYSFG